MATRDVNDELLCVAYGRAFRCFESIRELAKRDEADDALVLTRTLLFVATGALYLALPSDPAERRRRYQSSSLTSMKAEVTAAEEQRRAGFDITALDIDAVQKMIVRLEQAGVKTLPPVEQVATAVGLGPFYPRIFRSASAAAHYSMWSALDGYLDLPQGGSRPRVALVMPSPERAIEALELACVVYGAFLEKCDSVIRHGVTNSVQALLATYIGRRNDAVE